MSLLVPSTCFPVLTLVAHAYFWLDANSILSLHLFTSSSCHIFKCFPRTLFTSCTFIILCTLFAFIYIFSSFMHLLYSYLALAFFLLFCPYSGHFSCILFLPCLPSYYHMISSHILCILEHDLLIRPSFPMSFPLALLTLLYSLVFFNFISFTFFSPLTPSSPTLQHHLPLLHSLLLSPPSSTHLSTLFLTFSPLFFYTLISVFSFYIFGTT